MKENGLLHQKLIILILNDKKNSVYKCQKCSACIGPHDSLTGPLHHENNIEFKRIYSRLIESAQVGRETPVEK
jgi:hypothetical protein